MKSVQIRLPETEAKQIEQEAQRLGLSVSAYCRMQFFRRKSGRASAFPTSSAGSSPEPSKTEELTNVET